MRIRKIFKMEMAHRVKNAYTQDCRGLHGHSYKIEFFLEGNIDETGMIMDFTQLKEVASPFFDAMDHGIMAFSEDISLCGLLDHLNPKWVIVPFNPTAENMAKFFFQYFKTTDIQISKVIVHETETGYAEYTTRDFWFDRSIEQLIDLKSIKWSPEIMKKVVL